MRQDILQVLSENTYPGRGIVLGKSEDGHSVIAYFITGRSVNSRNRIFDWTPDGIETKAYDPSKMEDPSLIIYHPVRCLADGRVIVTNGDQTDTIKEAYDNGSSFEVALRTRTFEPDDPNWTPRISGVLLPDGSYKLSILKALDADPSGCARYFFEYENTLPGCGHLITTYTGDGSPLPSFQGEPISVSLPKGDLEAIETAMKTALDGERENSNFVALYTAFVDTDSGQIEQRILNKHTMSKEQ